MQRVKLLITVGILLLSAFCMSLNAQLIWEVPKDTYQNTMTINAEIRKNGGPFSEQSLYTVGVFDGKGICRGKNICRTTSTGRLHFPLTVYGNTDGEELFFKARRTDLTGAVMNFEQIVNFQTNYILGSGEFFVLNEKVLIEPTPDPENGDGWVVYISPDGSSSGVSNMYPAGDIKKAISALMKLGGSEPKSLILMGGTYTLYEAVLLQPGINIRSYQNDVVRLDGRGVNRVFQTESALRNGMTRTTGEPIVVENVIIQNGLAVGNGGGAYVDNTVSFKNCTFRGNRSTSKGGGLYGGEASGCLFENNTADLSASAACNAALSQTTVVRNGRQKNVSVLENVSLSNSIVWGNGSTLLVGGNIVRSAVEGNGHSGDKVLFLSSSNTENSDQLLAPHFVNVEENHENWALNDFSPLSKLVDFQSDLGAFQSNKKGVVFPAVSLSTDRVQYGNKVIPVAEIKNAFGEIIPQIAPAIFYRREDAEQWYLEPPTARANYRVKCEIKADNLWIQAPGFIAEAKFEIIPRILSVTANQVTRFYGEPENNLAYTLAGELLPGDMISGDLLRDQGENKSVGRYQIKQGTLTVNENYTITYQPADYIIAKRPVVIKAKAVEKLYFETDPELGYTVAFPEGVAGLTGEPVIGGDAFIGKLERENPSPLNNIGEYPIRLGSLALNDNYEISYQSSLLTIKKRPITIKALPATQVYGDAATKINYEVIGEMVNGNTFVGELSRQNLFVMDIGSYDITLGTLEVYANAMNYEITFVSNKYEITKRHIEIKADEKSIIYGENDPQLTYKILTGTLAYNDAITGELLRIDGKNVGTYSIDKGSLTISDNYYLSFVPAKLTIQPLAVTVTAVSKRKIYGEADPELTYAPNIKLIGDDVFQGTLTRAPGEEFGTYAIRQGSLLLSSNYQITFVDGTLTIGARPLKIKVRPVVQYYGEPEEPLLYDIEGLVAGDQLSGNLSRESAGMKTVGKYLITQGTLSVGNNYILAYQGATYEIRPRPITVSANPKEKYYFDKDPEFDYVVSFTEGVEPLTGLTSNPLVYGDKFTGVLSRGEVSLFDNAGIYPIQQGSLSLNDNYRITYVPADLKIKKISLTVRAAAAGKIYGDNDPVFTYDLVNGKLVNNDKFAGELARQNAGIQQVGEYENVIVKGNLQVLNNVNYEIEVIPGNFSIQKRSLEVTADYKTKTYGENDEELTYLISLGNLVFGDRLNGSLSRKPGEDAGVYSIELGTLDPGENYNLNFVGATYRIYPLAITATADLKNKIYGEKDPELTYITDKQLIGSDQFSGNVQRVSGESVGVYEIEQGSLLLSKNYLLSYVPAELTVNRREISIKAHSYTKSFGENDPNLAYTIGINGMAFNEELTGNLVRQEGEEIGNYVIEQGSLSANDNYTITKFEKGNLTIEPALVEILLDNLTHIYDRNPKAVTAITRPTGLPVKITYNGSTEPPVSIGRYTVIAVIDDRNYSGEVIEEMVISSPDLENNLKATKVLSKSSGESMTFRMEFEELVSENKIVFFDAKGKVVFEQTNYRSGDYDMSSLPEGTYFYVFSFTKNDGSRHVQKKFVEIIP